MPTTRPTTATEIEASAIAYAAGARADLAKARDELVADFDRDRVLDAERVQIIARHESEVRLWSAVERAVEYHEGSVIAAIRSVADDATGRIIAVLSASRSTNTMTNALVDVQHDATAAWLRSVPVEAAVRAHERGVL